MSDDNKLKRAKAAETIGPGTNAPPPVPKVHGSDLYRRAALKRVDPPAPQEYPRVKADASHWSLEPDWELKNAALLRVDLEPREGLGKRFKWLLERDNVENTLASIAQRLTPDELVTFRQVQDIIRRALAHNGTIKPKHVYIAPAFKERHYVVERAEFAAWAPTASTVPVPEWMKALAGESEEDRLRAENAELRAEIDRLRVPAVPRDEQGVTAVHGFVGATWTADGAIIPATSATEQKPREALVEEVRRMYQVLVSNVPGKGRARPSARQVALKIGVDRNRPDYIAAYKLVDGEAKEGK